MLARQYTSLFAVTLLVDVMLMLVELADHDRKPVSLEDEDGNTKSGVAAKPCVTVTRLRPVVMLAEPEFSVT